jgi:regulator of protease activity HflC (stomatin/prohibitin superfamily)
MPTIAIVLVAIMVLGFLLLSSTIKIVQEYERGVIFRPGRLVGARGPGPFFLIPGAERMRKVDLRIVTLDVPAQEAITRDNVTVKVNAVVYFRVLNPEEAVVKILDYTRQRIGSEGDQCRGPRSRAAAVDAAHYGASGGGRARAPIPV